ncbi:MAG: [FeFe] hydrogenase H-cluster radical SAM maturase HydE [Lentisphaerae bacterium RIFOXYB12_FULL_65_16]|nr:MAG: [FeFe] hydrogenase H-cluster radical SAM maturase HydE [Lentisphaerae bacterium RIFOXYA12_64_32]OGV84828.1 MAG: [FeFe] hydrogenase H-cluster radical SAM maturase HydE [Lentisphaerae bacterium RIFOXYB12_FULL_65_16]
MDKLLRDIAAGATPSEQADLCLLLQAQGPAQARLLASADSLRRQRKGDAVHLRGILEFSNYCRNDCAYCGIRRGNANVERYRMAPKEILAEAQSAAERGCDTLVLQSGEDPWWTTARLGDLVRAVKDEAGLAVTLSVGVRDRAELERLRADGADRWLLRFETSDPELFARIHPDESLARRLQCLRDLRELGYEVGSGFMIGLPPGTLEIIARDLLFARALHLDMIGCGPFIAHPDTPLAGTPRLTDSSVYYNTMALLRLLNPDANIPATTAFDALDTDGRNRVLQAGANVFMPNLTPTRYRRHYQLYPGKPCLREDGLACSRCAQDRLQRLGRTVARGEESRNPATQS